MCHSKQKIKNMEDDIDIYEDLPAFGTENDDNIKNNSESIIGGEVKLMKQIEELTEKVESFKKVNENLEMNLISLLKTAKAEISRKDRMIDELKKKLDDVTFKRRMYHKNGNSTTHKSTLHETGVNAHPTNGYFPPNQNTAEEDVEESYCNQMKEESNNKYNFIPLTVFGQRVAKRIADEQNLENKEIVKKFNKNDNNNENAERYVTESDKENGSLTDTNIPNSTEIQSPAITMYKEDKCVKSSLGASKLDTVNDIGSKNKNEISSMSEEKTIQNTSFIGKRPRTNDETNRYDSKKRIKLTEKDITETTRIELNTNIESTIHINERQYLLKNSYTRHTRPPSRYPVEDNNIDERRDSKRRSSALRDDRDTLKKYRDVDISNRDDYRYNHNQYHRTKSRERDRSDNYHSSRARSMSHVNFYREERYGRLQHTKYTSHENKFQKRHNSHSYSTNKLRYVKEEKDYSNIHSVTKSFTFERNSMDQKIIGIKRNDRYNGHESRKSRSRSIDRPHKQKAKNTQDSAEYLKHLELTNRTTEDDNVERMDPIIETQDVEVKNEPQNYSETKLEDTSGKLEDGQILDTDDKNYSKTKLEDTSTKLEDGQILDTDDNSLCKISQNVNNEESVNRELDNHLFPDVNDSTIVKAINNTLTVPNIEHVNSPENKEVTENISNNESIENVENIEKFIQNCASPCDKADEKGTINHALEEETTRNDIEINIADMIVDVCGEINSEDEKCENTLTITSNENLTENDRPSQITNINIAQDPCANTISTVEPLKETDKEKTDVNCVNNTINDTKSDTQNVGGVSPDSVKTENRSSIIVTETRVLEKHEQGLKQSKNVSGSRNNNKNAKVKSLNASNKIIVLSRRRKPVHLTDTSAKMTIYVNNERECNNNDKECHGT